LDPRSREYLKDRGFVIYLHAAPRELWRRTRHDRSRPLLQGGDPKGRLEELYARRDPMYRETADLVVETGRQSAGVLLGELLPSLEKVCGLST
jgi:shikimate kinase